MKRMVRLRALAFGLAVLLFTGCGMPGRAGSETESTVSSSGDAEEEAQVVFDDSLAEAAGEKEETVTVHADASGLPKRTSVSCVLRNTGDGTYVRDRSDLRDIKNANGDEDHEEKGGGLVLWENLGKDITYEGVTDRSAPVGVRVSYYLDGRKMEPSEIAGRSGDVRVRFDYVNDIRKRVKVRVKSDEQEWKKESRERRKKREEDREDDEGEIEEFEVKDVDDFDLVYEEKERTVVSPRMFVTMAVLPKDTFTDIKTENGNVMQIGTMKAVVGFAVPGISDTLALKDLEMTEDIDIPEYVEFTAHTDAFRLEFTATAVTNGLLSDFEEKDLEDIDELDEGMQIIRDISGEIVDGSGDLLDGADEMYDALVAYANGVNKLYEGTQSLTDGAAALDDMSGALTEGADGLRDGLTSLNEALADTDPEQLAQLGLPEDLVAMIGSLKSGIGELAEGSAQLADGVSAYTEGVGQLADGAAQLEEGADELSLLGQDLSDGYGKLFDGIDVLRDGLKTFDEEGIVKLTDVGGEELLAVVEGLRAVKAADDMKESFSGAAEGTESKVQYLIETEEVE